MLLALDPASDENVDWERSETSATKFFADYELREEIARGGMGIVYQAHQISLDRPVALKMILESQLATPSLVQRFHTEAEAAAKLEHPNIVPLYEVGEHRRSHFYSMKYVEGGNLNEWIDRQVRPELDVLDSGPKTPFSKTRKSLEMRIARLLSQVAGAVHYAHQRGVLHRDLKPSNILVDQDENPYVTDFGLAKLIELDSSLTHTTATLGTPSYMSPEQASGRSAQLTTAADVYSLGACLYEMLTGQPPFRGETATDTLHQVLEREPVTPRSIVPGVDRDLETICIKCLNKVPERRYASAKALEEDLNRRINGEPIQARPTTTVERLWSWSRRRPELAVLSGLVGSLLMTLVIGSIIASFRIASEREATVRENYYFKIRLAQNHIDEGDIHLAKEILLDCPEQLRHWEWEHLIYQCHQELLTIHVYTNNAHMSPGQHTSVKSMAVGDDRMATVSQDGEAVLWNLTTRSPMMKWGGPFDSISEALLSLDGSSLILCGVKYGVDVIDAKTGTLVRRLAEPTDNPKFIQFDEQERRLLVVYQDGIMEVWNLANFRRALQITDVPPDIRHVHLQPERMDLVTVHRDRVIVWDLIQGRSKSMRMLPSSDEYRLIDVSPDAESTVAIDRLSQATLWHGESKHDLLSLRHVDSKVRPKVFFSPAGNLLTMAGVSRQTRVWDIASGREQFALGHPVRNARFSRDGRLLAASDGSHGVWIWNTSTGDLERKLKGHRQAVEILVFSRDGRKLFTCSRDGEIKVWTTTLGREQFDHPGLAFAGAVNPESRLAATAHWYDAVHIWNIDTGHHRLASIGQATWWTSMAFSPDGKRLVLGGDTKRPPILDTQTGEVVMTLKGHERAVHAVAYSPDGQWIGTGSPDRTVRLWDAKTGKEMKPSWHAPDHIWFIAFSVDSQFLSAGGGAYPEQSSGFLEVYSLSDRSIVLSDTELSKPIGKPVWHPVRHEILAGQSGGNILRWDIHSERRLKPIPTRTRPNLMTFSSDGARLFVGTSLTDTELSHGLVEVRDAELGTLIMSLKGHSEAFLSDGLFFLKDGRRLISMSTDKALQWEVFPWKQNEMLKNSGSAPERNLRRYAYEYWTNRLELEGGGVQPRKETIVYQRMPERSEWPERDPEAIDKMVDLTEFYNGFLDIPTNTIGFDTHFDEDYSSLGPGIHQLGGIGFDIRGMIWLYRDSPGPWATRVWRRYPKNVRIPINQTAKAVHFLHGYWSGPPSNTDRPIARYLFTYSSGQKEELLLVPGSNILGMVGDQSDTHPDLAVWRAPLPSIGSKTRSQQLSKWTWTNPSPDQSIQSIDFVSSETYAAPFLVAITLD